MNFNLVAALVLLLLVLTHDYLRLHDENVALRERVASVGPCTMFASRKNDVTVQHCIRTVYVY